MRTARVLLGMLVLGLAGLLLLPTHGQAHAFLVATAPRAGERLQAAPSSVKLQFSEPVAPGERVEVKTGDGVPVGAGPPGRREGGRVVEAPLPPLDSGVYVVSWQVVATDGHQTVGELAFAVGEGGDLPAPTGQQAPIDWAGAAAGWLLLGGLLLAAGGLASERLVWAPVSRRHAVEVPRLPVGWLLAVALLGAVLQLSLLGPRAAAAGADAAGEPQGWAAMLTTRPGLLAIATVALVAYGLWLVAVPVRWARAWAALPLGLALAAAALRGHAGTTPTWWAGPANVAHLGAAALWVGALAHLAVVAWRLRGQPSRAALRQGALRYAAVASGLVAVVAASGTLVAISQFTAPAELVRTAYGRTLLVKVLLVAAALLLALVARRRAIGTNPHPRVGLLRRLTRLEAGALLATVTVAAILAATPAPRGAATSGFLLGPPPLEGPVVRVAGLAGRLAVYVEATAGRLQVRALAPSGDPAPEARVRIQGRAADGSGLTVLPRPCGSGCVTSQVAWRAGTTTLGVGVSARNEPGGHLEVGVPWPPRPEAPALLHKTITAMRAQPRVAMTERVSSGPGASSEQPFTIQGAKFMENELYAAGGAADVRPLPGPPGAQRLTLFLPGSDIWYLLELDARQRLRRERIVNPGHLIERSFSYPA